MDAIDQAMMHLDSDRNNHASILLKKLSKGTDRNRAIFFVIGMSD
jgi:hypothetical protein